MAADYERVLSRLERVRYHPSSQMWSASCPCGAHHKNGDRHPSLLLWIGRSGNLLARCKSGGCTWPEIVAAAGTTAKDWFPEEERKLEATKGKIVATYPYHDASCKLAYECCRIEPGRDGRRKDFRYRRPQPGGSGWIWNLEGVEKVLYRLPELLDPSREKHPIFVVEGEGKVETLRKLGYLATSSPCGAGHWLQDFGKVLRNRRVAILPDNDDPGWLHAIQVAGSLVCWHAAEIRVVRLPQLPEHGDVTDWLADWPEGADDQKREALKRELKAAPVWKRS